MLVVFRSFVLLWKWIGFLVSPLAAWLSGGYKRRETIPPIKNDLLNISAIELAEQIRCGKTKSEDVVRAYIDRIKEVNVFLNAVVEDRFDDALEEARRADKLATEQSVVFLTQNYPLLGIPFTVKESCGLAGLSFTGCSKPRIGITALKDGEVVGRLRAAGCIPLCVTNTPEYCFCWETSNLITGRTNNPYDTQRTSGGSSGGEAALLGCGASLFGVGSDIAGSIRVPAMFVGIFGHKPTAGLVSTVGHFPNSSDPNFSKYLVMGPMTRFASDMPLLTHIMSGENNNRLNFDDPQSFQAKDIKIYYREDAGFAFGTTAVDFDIKLALLRAKNYFQQQGALTEVAQFGDLQETLDMSIAVFFAMEDVPDFLVDPADPKRRDSLLGQIGRSLVGRSKYSFPSLLFLALYETGGFIRPSQRPVYKAKMERMRQRMITALGTNGVFFYPTFPISAPRHGTVLTKVSGVMYSMFFNLVGFPSTHVPLGFDRNGMPIGIQVIAAPHQDRLCFGIAKELERAFGGWVAPEKRTK